MLKMSDNWLTDITAPSRIIDARVEVYRASTLVYTFLPDNYLSSFKIERVPEDGKLFGYSICQKATVEIIDAAAAPFELQKDDEVRIFVGTETELAKNPYFYIDEITRDEVKKKITIVAYDLINKSTKHTWSEVGVTYPIKDNLLMEKIANFLGTTAVGITITATKNIQFTADAPPNLDGSEVLRDVINKLAEAMGRVAFMNHKNELCFRKVAGRKSPVSITKDDYFELKLGGVEQLTEIIAVNELEDVSAFVGTKDGRTHIMRSNPFVENREDTQAILQDILDTDNDDLFYTYSIKWRGNPSLEIGDRVNVEKEDGTTIDLFYLGETLTYNGGLVATSEWKLTQEDSVETPPQTIGDAIKQTSAKVDKVNKEITLVASQVSATEEELAGLRISTTEITSSVEQLQRNVEQDKEATEGQLADIRNKVEASITAEDLTIKVQEQIANGVDKVTTATGFTFNEEGLTVEKTGSQMKTQITEDGMTVYRDDTAVLVADNVGVEAHNLHAVNFLIIGEYSRFEDYIDGQGEPRTGCFWLK